MTPFDFNQAFATGEAHHPATRTLLSKGPHVVTLEGDIENITSSGGYPMLVLRWKNDEGYQRDRLVISPKEFSVAKIVGLIEAAGLERPETEDVDPNDGRLSDEYVQRLERRLRVHPVGIVVREEKDREDPDKLWPRVAGYVPAVQVDADIPVATPTVGDGFEQTSFTANDDDIPF